MVFRQHVPCEPLARYVDWLWFYADLYPPHRREHVLPDGTFELIIDLREEPRRLFDRGGKRETLFRRAWISGAHSKYTSWTQSGVRRPSSYVEALLAGRTPQAKFAKLEHWLLQRLNTHAPDALEQKRVFWARDRLLAADPPRIREVVAQLGISHRRFIEDFRSHVGLTPKRFCRIRRFQQVVAQVSARKGIDWADVAYSCGYFDQAHFANDFRELSGFRPSEYLRNATGEYPTSFRSTRAGKFFPIRLSAARAESHS